MIKKKLGLITTSALVVGLVACNNNEGAFETDNRTNTMDVAENVNYNGRTSYGPFTRDINTLDRVDNNRFRTTNPDNNIKDNDYELVTDRFMGNKDPNGMTISSSKTDLSSDKYPHTKAIAVQEAKYKFIKANSNEDAEKQARQFIEQQKQQAQQKANQLAQRYTGQANQQQAQQQAANQQQAQTKQQADAQQNNQATNQQPAQQQAPAQQEQAKAPAQQQTPAKQEQAKAPAENQQPAQGVNQAVQQVIDLTNAERRKNGLPDLKADTQLNGVAQKKSEDMRQNNYFSHTSPTYGSPFDMMRDFGVTYKTAGENIAQGQRTPQEVVQAWMNSEGHRKNILSKDFTHIGIGYDSNGHHWTQMFVGR
ncbi:MULTISPECIES: CAP domain-containing protein [Bacillaceae]|uniref:CAP domain-containing protein n=1 Tax=Bacillaceae TaxID=186817 RepID=UPI00267E5EFA